MDENLSLRDSFLMTAVLGSHSNFQDRGFRQKDVRFLYELFGNWMDSRVKAKAHRIHNTQVQRYLNDLCAKGWCRKHSQDRQGRYSMTRLGMIEFMQALTDPEGSREFVQFQFTSYFIRTYGQRIQELVQSKGSGFSKALQMEMSLLLDHATLLKERIRRIDHEIQRLKLRMKETEETVRLTQKLANQGKPLGDIVNEVSKEFPYELQAQKPMSDLMQEIPPELRLWELTEGNSQRVGILWRSLLLDLEAERRILKEMSGS